MPNELVIGDDWSTDQTIEIIRKFAQKVPFDVKITINNFNLGSTKNFEQTIARCSGDIIVLSDQDDVWVPHKLDWILSEFDARRDICLVFSDADLVDENLNELGSTLWDTVKTKTMNNGELRANGLASLLFQRNFVTGATMAFRSDLKKVLEVNRAPEGYVHDHWIAILAYSLCKVVGIDKSLIHYRQHSGQQIGTNAVRRTVKQKRRHVRTERYDEIVVNLISEIEAYSRFLRYLISSDRKMNDKGVIPEMINAKIADTQEKLLHFSTRRNFSTSRIRRLSGVLHEIRSGRYFQYSRGLRSALFDLIEPYRE